jgi:hypothetical protein
MAVKRSLLHHDAIDPKPEYWPALIVNVTSHGNACHVMGISSASADPYFLGEAIACAKAFICLVARGINIIPY